MAEKYKPRFALRWDRYYGQGIYSCLRKCIPKRAKILTGFGDVNFIVWAAPVEECVGVAAWRRSESGVERIEIFVGDADARRMPPRMRVIVRT